MVQSAARFQNTSRANDAMNQVKDRVSEMGQCSQEMISEHPASMTLVAFGFGLGIGVLVAHSLLAPKRRPMPAAWYDQIRNYLPSMENFQAPNMPNIPAMPTAKQMKQFLPEAIAKHL